METEKVMMSRPTTTCNICGARFGIKSKLEKHMEQHAVQSSANTELDFVCFECNIYFDREDKLVHHISTIHPERKSAQVVKVISSDSCKPLKATTKTSVTKDKNILIAHIDFEKRPKVSFKTSDSLKTVSSDKKAKDISSPLLINTIPTASSTCDEKDIVKTPHFTGKVYSKITSQKSLTSINKMSNKYERKNAIMFQGGLPNVAPTGSSSSNIKKVHVLSNTTKKLLYNSDQHYLSSKALPKGKIIVYSKMVSPTSKPTDLKQHDNGNLIQSGKNNMLQINASEANKNILFATTSQVKPMIESDDKFERACDKNIASSNAFQAIAKTNSPISVQLSDLNLKDNSTEILTNSLLTQKNMLPSNSSNIVSDKKTTTTPQIIILPIKKNIPSELVKKDIVVRSELPLYNKNFESSLFKNSSQLTITKISTSPEKEKLQISALTNICESTPLRSKKLSGSDKSPKQKQKLLKIKIPFKSYHQSISPKSKALYSLVSEGKLKIVLPDVKLQRISKDILLECNENGYVKLKDIDERKLKFYGKEYNNNAVKNTCQTISNNTDNLNLSAVSKRTQKGSNISVGSPSTVSPTLMLKNSPISFTIPKNLIGKIKCIVVPTGTGQKKMLSPEQFKNQSANESNEQSKSAILNAAVSINSEANQNKTFKSKELLAQTLSIGHIKKQALDTSLCSTKIKVQELGQNKVLTPQRKLNNQSDNSLQKGVHTAVSPGIHAVNLKNKKILKSPRKLSKILPGTKGRPKKQAQAPVSSIKKVSNFKAGKDHSNNYEEDVQPVVSVVESRGRRKTILAAKVVRYGVEEMRRDNLKRQRASENLMAKEKIIKKMLLKYEEKEIKKHQKFHQKKMTRFVEKNEKHLSFLKDKLLVFHKLSFDDRLRVIYSLKNCKKGVCDMNAFLKYFRVQSPEELSEKFEMKKILNMVPKKAWYEKRNETSEMYNPTPIILNLKPRRRKTFIQRNFSVTPCRFYSENQNSTNRSEDSAVINYSGIKKSRVKKSPVRRKNTVKKPDSSIKIVKQKVVKNIKKNNTLSVDLGLNYEDDPFTMTLNLDETHKMECPCHTPNCDGLHPFGFPLA